MKCHETYQTSTTPNAIDLGIEKLSLQVVGDASLGSRRGPAAADRPFLICKFTRSISRLTQRRHHPNHNVAAIRLHNQLHWIYKSW